MLPRALLDSEALALLSGFGFRVSGFGFRVSGFTLRVSGFTLRVEGFGFWVSGFGFRFRVSSHLPVAKSWF